VEVDVQEVRQLGGHDCSGVQGQGPQGARGGDALAWQAWALSFVVVVHGGDAYRAAEKGRCKEPSRWGRRQLGGTARQEGRSIRGGAGEDLSARAPGGSARSGEWHRQQGREWRLGPAMQGRSQGPAGEIGRRRWRRLCRRNI
jgi:hypothetical protein